MPGQPVNGVALVNGLLKCVGNLGQDAAATGCDTIDHISYESLLRHRGIFAQYLAEIESFSFQCVSDCGSIHVKEVLSFV